MDPKNIHRHDQCKLYSTIDARKARVKSLNICFKCLKSGHRERECQKSCYHCHGRHHAALCSLKDRVSLPHHKNRESSHRSRESVNDRYHRPRDDARRDSSRDSRRDYSRDRRDYSRDQRDFSNESRRAYSKDRRDSSRDSRNGNWKDQDNWKRSSHHASRQPTRGNSPHPKRDTKEFDYRRVQFTNSAVVDNHKANDRDDTNGITISMTTTAYPSQRKEYQVTPKESVHSDTNQQKSVAMLTRRVTVMDSEGRPQSKVAFIDNGSTRSYASRDLIKSLNLAPWDDTSILLQTFANPKLVPMHTELFKVHFQVNGKVIFLILTAVPKLPKHIPAVDMEDESIHDLLADPHAVLPRVEENPDILIGLDSMQTLLGKRSVDILPNGMELHTSNIGTIIAGCEAVTIAAVDNEKIPTVPLHSKSAAEEHADLCKVLQDYFGIESHGISETPRTTDEELAAKFYEATTFRQADGRYVCRWPFIDDLLQQLPDNRYLAYHRLMSTVKRLQKDAKLYQQYQGIMDEQLKRGFIEEVVNDIPF